MDLILLTLGILLLIVGTLDFFWTALWVDGGAGPLTRRLANALWKSLRKISGDRPQMLSFSGPLILSLTLLSWIFFLWLGWTLIFLSDPNSLAGSQNNEYANWSDKLYYTGYLVFTLGNGDFKPTNAIWQTATVLATGSGMLFITLAVTYLLSVLNAVTLKRSFAESVTGIGGNGGEIVKNAWNGTDFHDINLVLNTYATQISTLCAQHKAYPILHYYQTSNAKEALSVAFVIFDEALTIFQHGIPEGFQPNKLLLKESRSSIDSFLDTINPTYVSPSKNPPSALELESLRKAGLPVVSNEKFALAVGGLKGRRQKLLGIIEANARQWPAEKKSQ
ncbi:potassium channel family protein [Planomicrobium sp. CPCC 101110]|uniref:potassium channel family protein n=1 Tax=Planomicrobium sp. CPCC 101110 TaxID=2599619 RepID=UPI0011B8445A|nr:potassium channel family protein [Planomicrobium sp. CPCC 101110]TWT25883.1 two pore domain potassium channel family protein [Planomicrobium sp. CPCC 101110]